jgi:hypothetical protein
VLGSVIGLRSRVNFSMPLSRPKMEVCAAGGFGVDRRKAGELVGPRRHQGRLLAPSKGSLAACLAHLKVTQSQPWWGLFVALRSEVLQIVGSSAAAIEFVDNLCAPRCATASYCCKVCAPLLVGSTTPTPRAYLWPLVVGCATYVATGRHALSLGFGVCLPPPLPLLLHFPEAFSHCLLPSFSCILPYLPPRNAHTACISLAACISFSIDSRHRWPWSKNP